MSGTHHVASRDEGPPVGGVVSKFPAQPYVSASSFFAAYFQELARAAASVDSAQVERAAAVLVEAYSAGARVLSCGNGGSASIANHFQCDHLRVGRGTDLSPALAPKVLSLSTNIELLTAIANDIGYEDVFRYQLEAQSQPGDVLMAISSSGRSANIARAVSWARGTMAGARLPLPVSTAAGQGWQQRSPSTLTATITASLRTSTKA